MTDLSRYNDWLTWLRKQGEDDPDVLVIWVGGSAATGGYDQWSDLDVDLLCTTGAHDATYARLLARLLDDFDVDHVWELPADVWPDGRQCFVNLQHRPGLLEEPTRIVENAGQGFHPDPILVSAGEIVELRATDGRLHTFRVYDRDGVILMNQAVPPGTTTRIALTEPLSGSVGCAVHPDEPRAQIQVSERF